jgi:DNA modification methylase
MKRRTVTAGDFLDRTAKWMRKKISANVKLGAVMVEQDIAYCWEEAKFGKEWAMRRARIQSELDKIGINESKWTKRAAGIDISEMRRRVHLFRDFDKYYVPARRRAGNTGQSGLYYGLSLISHRTGAESGRGTSPTRSVLLSETAKPGLDPSRVTFVTGDALVELRKMKANSVNVVICPPSYWPLKRENAGQGVGYEEKLEDYLAYQVAVFREIRRILSDEGVLWIVIGDSYVKRGGYWDTDPKSGHSAGLLRQDSTYLRPMGNLLLIPPRLAMALQDDGWILRHEIVWDKGWCRPENVTDRVTRTHEMVYMFAKRRGYFYDPDPIREPLVRPFSPPGKQRPGLVRRDKDRVLPTDRNPMGRNSGSVWHIPPSRYRGRHDATFPPELVRRMLAVSCDDLETDVVVLDPYGGAGTTALVALQHGYRAISIDIDPAATDEARERLANAPANFQPDADGNDESVDAERAAD